MAEITSMLRRENYCLMTDEAGVELYDEKGDLLVCKAESGDWITVPNSEAIRKLYDLPKEGGEKNAEENINITLNSVDGQDKTFILQENNEPLAADEDSMMIWLGQRTERCTLATKALIDLINSPRYQRLMNDRSTIKLKVWERVALELQNQGYSIAKTSKEAGLRTFQKWRNLERTYWKYKRTVDELGKDNKRKKPAFFDEMHAVLLKRKRFTKKQVSNTIAEEDADATKVSQNEEMDGEAETNSECLDNLSMDIFRRPKCVPLPEEVVSLLVSLVTSPKYKHMITSCKFQKVRVWENIYDDIMAKGFKFAATRREGALKLGQKWRNLEKTFLRRQNRQQSAKKLYSPNLYKSILNDISRKTTTQNLLQSHYTDSALNSDGRKLKDGEFTPAAVEALLKLIDSDEYQELFNGGGKKTRIWEKINDEMEAMGFSVYGESKRRKSQKLFQKWRNLKRAFIRYQIGKDTLESDAKKPVCYDLLFKIMSKEILKNSYLPEEELLNASDFLQCSQMDHDYEGTGNCSVSTSNSLNVNKTNPSAGSTPSTCFTTTPVLTMTSPIMTPVSISTNQEPSIISNHTTESRPKPSTSTQSTIKSSAILLQIKALHETTLAVQQQQFAKVTALLEEQIRKQNTLTELIAQYITNQPKKVKPDFKDNLKNDGSSNSTRIKSVSPKNGS